MKTHLVATFGVTLALALGAASGCGAEDGLTATYTRDANLCLEFDACVAPGICPLYRPACAEGYVLASWPAGPDACPAFACDPAFLTR